MKKLSKFDNLIILITSYIFCQSSIPLKVTVDGYFYLSNAKLFFTKDFAQSYYWVRDPGYSIFLRLIHGLFGNSDRIVIGIQGSLMIFSFYLLMKVLLSDLKNKRMKLLLYVLLLTCFINPLNIFYSGMILQQSLFTAFINLLVYFYVKNKSSIMSRGNIIVLIIFIISASLTSIVLVLYTFATLFLFLLIRYLGNRKEFKLFGILFTYFSLLMISLLIVFSWGQYKNASISNSSENYDLNLLSKTPFSNSTDNSYLSEELTSLIFRIKGLTHLGPTILDSGAHETDIFVGWMMNPDFRCGAYDAFELKPYTDFARNYFQPSCPGATAFKVQNVFYSQYTTYQLEIAWYFYFFTTLLMVFLILFRFRYQISTAILVSGSTFLWLLIYSLGTNGNYDRYGMPVYGLMLLSITNFSFIIFNFLKSKYNLIFKS